jgi:ferric-dicitrate binding protein FerR (iron transport regulator)
VRLQSARGCLPAPGLDKLPGAEPHDERNDPAVRKIHTLDRFLSAPYLSPAVISRLTAQWQADYETSIGAAVRVRLADGVYLQARMEDNAECTLV